MSFFFPHPSQGCNDEGILKATLVDSVSPEPFRQYLRIQPDSDPHVKLSREKNLNVCNPTCRTGVSGTFLGPLGSGFMSRNTGESLFSQAPFQLRQRGWQAVLANGCLCYSHPLCDSTQRL